jgi:hypothetical protein
MPLTPVRNGEGRPNTLRKNFIGLTGHFGPLAYQVFELTFDFGVSSFVRAFSASCSIRAVFVASLGQCTAPVDP